jgi:DNA processing protein
MRSGEWPTGEGMLPGEMPSGDMRPGETLSDAERSAWVTLTRTPALDVARLSAALEVLGTARALIDASEAGHERAGLPAAAREYLARADAAPTPAERAWLEDPSHHIVPCSDPRFPRLLRAAKCCPIALYVEGRPEVLNDPQLAVVGSRNPSAQGRDNAFELSERLAERGLAIVSGLAEGIDSAAHRGALRASGVTLAVLGAGVDVIYPRGNLPLSSEIKLQGALVSEFPLGEPPRKQHFPQRNRIIAGMTLGTLVVEAARRSGSLITARLAGDYGRELFAVPGSIRNPLSRGCHELIRQGAKLTETADDILTELNFSAFFDAAARAPQAVDAAGAFAPGMDKDHKILLDALGFDPVDLDVLVVRTGFKPEAVSSMMLILELEGHVQAAPGGHYARVDRSRR